MGDPFDEHLDQWRDYCETPWGRIRFAVVAEVLGRHVAAMASDTGRSLRVLDVGGGDGRDSMPLAAAGHQVTVLDTAPGMLAEARRRAHAAGVEITAEESSLDDLPSSSCAPSYDLVLCHFVLHYRSPCQRPAHRRRRQARADVLRRPAAPRAGAVRAGALLADRHVLAPGRRGRAVTRHAVSPNTVPGGPPWSTIQRPHHHHGRHPTP